MSCIARRPRCGVPEGEVIPEPLSDIASAIGTIVGVIGGIATIAKLFGLITVEGGLLIVAGVTVGTAAAAGTLSGFAAAMSVIVIVGLYAFDRCVQGDGLQECIAGIVYNIVGSFSDALEEIFPFAAMHDRVDVVVKSRFWDVVENGEAFVHCTDVEPPRRSEIMRCYYYDRRVCDAARGAQIGVAVGAVAGLLAAAAIAAAIGCATVILCIVAIIVAALLAAVAALVGALIGGQIAKAISENDAPSAEGVEIAVSDYITVRGHMQRREHDNGANVIWWASDTSLHGRASADFPRPFSYCEVNDELTVEGCELPGSE